MRQINWLALRLQNHLHGRVILSKRDKPLIHLDLTKMFQPVWKALGLWKAFPLGKVFMSLSLLL